MIKLGRTVRDTITGFEGVATGCAEYLWGCKKILIEGKVQADGKMPSQWVDEQRVEYSDSETETPESEAPGGPQLLPPR